MRLGEREMPMDPEIERELEAIDRALAGHRVDPDLENLAVLAAEIRAERPEPAAEVAAFLDQLSADGFPPRASDRPGRASTPGVRRLLHNSGGGRSAADPRVQRHRGLRGRRRCWDLGERNLCWRSWRRPAADRSAGLDRDGPGQDPALEALGNGTSVSAAGGGPRLSTGRIRNERANLPAPLPLAPWPVPPVAIRPATSTSSSPRRPTTSATPRTACSTWSVTITGSCSARMSPGETPESRAPSAVGRASTCGSPPGSCRRRWATSRTWATSSPAPTARTTSRSGSCRTTSGSKI